MRRSIHSSRRGFSLVEVVASLFLVGTLLVAVLVAHRRAVQQTRMAQRRLEAVEVLDELLEARRRPDSGELQLARGKAPGANPYHWRSTLRFEPALEGFGAGILRIELYDPDFEDGRTVSSVEIAAPNGGAAGANHSL